MLFLRHVIYSSISLHIPKTGGSAIRKTFHMCEGFYFPKHSTIATQKICNNTKCYAVIRNPYDRVFSSFTYYKYGSSLYNPSKRIATNLTFNEFLHSWSNVSSANHAFSKRITKIRDWKRTPWVWNVHFAPQSLWVNDCNVKILCYSKYLLDMFSKVTNCTYKSAERVNPTHPNKEYQPIWDELDPHVKAFIVRQYYTDFNLYNTHCTTHTNMSA